MAVSCAYALYHMDRHPRRNRESRGLLGRGLGRIDPQVLRARCHARGLDQVGDAEVDVQVVPQPRTVRHERASAPLTLQIAVLLQAAQHLPQCRSAHFHGPGKVSLGRDARAGPPFAALNPGHQGLFDLVTQLDGCTATRP